MKRENSELKILIVNDDGIEAEGLRRLAEAARNLGRVWVVAPEQQCSGMSQKLTIFEPIPVRPRSFPIAVEGAWSVGGTPADCVKAAINYLLPEKPDILLSGINMGYNAGFDIAYSGTIGAAMEGLMKGVPAIAFSNAYEGGWECAEHWLLPLMEELLESPLPENEMWNVNFPGIPLSACGGVRRDRSIAPLQLYRDRYMLEEREDGSLILHNAARPICAEEAPEGSDVHAVLSGYVSVGRITCQVL